MIQKITKGSDILLSLKLKDANDLPYRIWDLEEFRMKIYTTNPHNFIEVTYKDDVFTGIVTNDDADFVVLNSDDLIKLDDGVICYQYHIKFTDENFKDQSYDEVITGQTNLYLKSNC